MMEDKGCRRMREKDQTGGYVFELKSHESVNSGG